MRAVGGSYLFDGGYAGVAITRFASDYHIPTLEGAATQTHIRLEQTKITSKGEFRPRFLRASPPLRYWAGYTDYKHDEIGLNDIGFEQISATFNNREKEGKVEVEFDADVHAVRRLDQRRRSAGRPQPARYLRRGAPVPGPHADRRRPISSTSSHTPTTLRTQLAGRVEASTSTAPRSTFPAELPATAGRSAGVAALAQLRAQEHQLQPVSRTCRHIWSASLTLQRIERAPRALELFSKGPHDATQTFDIGNPSLSIETAKTVEIGLKRTHGDFPLRRQGLLHPLRQLHLPAADRQILRRGFRVLRHRWNRASADRHLPARCDLPRRAKLAWQWDVAAAGGPGIFGVDGQYDTVRATFTDGSNVPRMPPQRLGGGAYWRNDNWFVRMGLLHAWAQNDVGAVRDADRRLQSGQGGDRASAILEVFAVGTGRGHDRDRRRQPARRRRAQLHPVPQGRNPAARAQLQVLPQRQVRRRASRAARPATSRRASSKRSDAPMVYKAPIMTAWNWGGFYVGGNAGYSTGRTITINSFDDPTGRPAVRDQWLQQARRRDLRRAGRLQLDGEHLGIGIEGDIQFSRQRGNVDVHSAPATSAMRPLAPLDAPVSVASRPQAGVVWNVARALGTTVTPDALAYVTAGVAFGDITITGTHRWLRRRRQRAQRRLQPPPARDGAGRSAPASKRTSSATGPPRSSISTWTSARSRLSRRCRWMTTVAATVNTAPHRQHRADRRELQIRSERSDVRQVLIAPVAVWRRRSGCNAGPHDRPHALLDDDVT